MSDLSRRFSVSSQFISHWRLSTFMRRAAVVVPSSSGRLPVAVVLSDHLLCGDCEKFPDWPPNVTSVPLCYVHGFVLAHEYIHT